MSYAKNAAEQAFKKAQNELEIALEKFHIARDELAKITGEFIVTNYPIKNFSSESQLLASNDGSYIPTEF